MNEMIEKLKELMEETNTKNKEIVLEKPEEESDHVRLYTSISVPKDTDYEDFEHFDLIMKEIDDSMSKILEQETEDNRTDLMEEDYKIHLFEREEDDEIIIAPLIHLKEQGE